MDKDDKTLYTIKGEPIPWLEPRVEEYLDLATLVFGASGSGKTTIIDQVMYLTKEFIPNCICIIPKTSRKVYDGKVHPRCIKENLSKSKIEKIWKRQENMTMIYNIANDPKVLEELYNNLKDKKTKIMIDAMERYAKKTIKEIDVNKRYTFPQKKSQIANIKNMCVKKITTIYRSIIRQNREFLLEKAKKGLLSQKAMIAINFLDINPRLLIVIDDNTENFKKWMKYFKPGDTNPFESIFYRGRHNFITLIFAAHDDKVVVPELRKNARVIYYTTSQSLVASISKTGNGFTSADKKYAQRAADRIFSPNPDGIKTYEKLCYIRESTTPFCYSVANLYPDFTVGSAPLDELVKRMPEKKDDLASNPYLKNILPQKKESNKKRANRRIMRSRKTKY